jgi:hypothetical protein
VAKTSDYTRGFRQYHRLDFRTEEYLNAPMGWVRANVASCSCGKWSKRFEYRSVRSEISLRKADPITKAHEAHLEKAWQKRENMKNHREREVWAVFLVDMEMFSRGNRKELFALMTDEKAAEEIAARWGGEVEKWTIYDSSNEWYASTYPDFDKSKQLGEQ